MNLPIGVVLIVGADANVLQAMESLELGKQFSLRFCNNAVEARKILQSEEVEVALVDQHLLDNGPTGVDLLAVLREQDADCYRILFTAATDIDFFVSAINQGLIDAFLIKPWTAEQLISLLNQGCETALLRRHNRELAGELASRNTDLENLNSQLERMVEERTASLRETNEKLRQQQQEVVRLETQSTITQLARGLAHELNNPLAAILGYSQRLLRRLGSDLDAAQRLEVILSEVERCRGLVDQLHNLATPLDEERKVCDPKELLQSAIDRIRSAHNLPPHCVKTESLPKIIGAPRSLSRVFELVLDNARIAGATECELSAETVNDRVNLIVTNNGQSPTDNAILHAVRPFFTTHHDSGHRGLGLALATALLRDQNGSITLEHRNDGKSGARCIITLPRADPVSEKYKKVQHPESGKVLIVDDDPMITELLSECLQEDGVSVVVVGNGADAQQAIIDHPIRAVIADYYLDRDNGVAVLKSLIARQPGLQGHVAVFTGVSDAATLGKIAAETGYKILAKPFRLEQVQQLVREIF